MSKLGNGIKVLDLHSHLLVYAARLLHDCISDGAQSAHASIICHKQSAVAKGIVIKESIRRQRFHADRLTGYGGGFHASLLMMIGTFTGLDTGIQIGIAYVNGIRVVQLVAIHTTFTLPHGLG